MSAKLSALFSDSYVEISQYRDQHFKVSEQTLKLSLQTCEEITPSAIIPCIFCVVVLLFGVGYSFNFAELNILEHVNVELIAVMCVLCSGKPL